MQVILSYQIISVCLIHNANTALKSKEEEDYAGLADVIDDVNEIRKKNKVLTNEVDRKASMM